MRVATFERWLAAAGWRLDRVAKCGSHRIYRSADGQVMTIAAVHGGRQVDLHKLDYARQHMRKCERQSRAAA